MRKLIWIAVLLCVGCGSYQKRTVISGDEVHYSPLGVSGKGLKIEREVYYKR